MRSSRFLQNAAGSRFVLNKKHSKSEQQQKQKVPAVIDVGFQLDKTNLLSSGNTEADTEEIKKALYKQHQLENKNYIQDFIYEAVEYRLCPTTEPEK